MRSSTIRASVLRLAAVMSLAALLHAPVSAMAAVGFAPDGAMDELPFITPPALVAEKPAAELGSLALQGVFGFLTIRLDAGDAIGRLRSHPLLDAGSWSLGSEERQLPLPLPAPLRLIEPDFGYI